MKNYFKLIILFMFFVNACAPKVQEREFPKPTSEFGPRGEDTDLSPVLKPADSVAADLRWEGDASTASFFQQAENLVVLGKQTGRFGLTEKGLNWIASFYNAPRTSSFTEFSKTPFATLAVAQTEEEVRKALNRFHNELSRSRALLKQMILSSGEKFPRLNEVDSLYQIVDHAEAFSKIVLKKIGTLDLPEVVAEGVSAEIKKENSRLLTEVRYCVAQLYNTSLFSRALRVVESAVEKFKVTLSPETAKSIAQGRLIARDLDGMSDAQGGLTALIDIWRVLSPQERIEYYKNANESLYDFLSKQDEKNLDCLRQEGCSGGLFQGIAKKLFILPRIRDYGVEKLHDKLNGKILQYLMEQITSFGLEFVAELPVSFAEQVDLGLVAKDSELKEIQGNYPDYLKGLLAKWSEKSLSGTKGKISGFEAPLVKLQISNKKKMSIEAAASALDLKANAVGASLTANALFLQNSPQNGELKTRIALSQINKLIAIGGYRDDSKKLVPALMMPIEKTQTPLDLKNFAKSNYSYRIPDKIKMLDSFQASKEPYDKNFSATAYAEQLKGLSQMLNFTADWKKTAFEDSIGKIQAQELTKEITNPALARPLFPKDMLFALNVGDAAVLLKNITKKSTPVFLITLDDKTIWADQYRVVESESAIMAGLVDIKDGLRSSQVQGPDVAKFILAIQEFWKATDGVENTRSPLLLEKDDFGRTPLQALLKGRQELRLLTIALANFISSNLVNEDSFVQQSFSLIKMKKIDDGNYRIEDQALAIRALLAAWEVTGVEAYIWTAQDIYFAMNKHAFSEQDYFYVNGDRSSLSFPQKVDTVRALVELKPSLPPASQAQLNRILGPWLTALEELQ